MPPASYITSWCGREGDVVTFHFPIAGPGGEGDYVALLVKLFILPDQDGALNSEESGEDGAGEVGRGYSDSRRARIVWAARRAVVAESGRCSISMVMNPS